MRGFHGIINAYMAAPGLKDLVSRRVSVSLPFCARYRLIDFMLSSMVNAGMRNIGVIMQRDYQSLLDHLGSGKDWDLSRRSGGLKLLPPFGLADSHMGEYKGSMEAMTALSSYIEHIPEEQIVMTRGDIVANIDLNTVMESHIESGAEVTAVCTETTPSGAHHRFLRDDDGFASELLCRRRGEGPGYPSLETYIISKQCLLGLMSYCSAGSRLHFHRDALTHYISSGGRINLYLHRGYTAIIGTVKDYYRVSMDMFNPENRAQVFPESRPIRTKERSEVSTYYGPHAAARSSLVADGCYIEGEINNCILFRGVRVGKGAKLSNCVIMQDTNIGENASLSYVICDKDVTVSQGAALAGNGRIQLTIPKGALV